MSKKTKPKDMITVELVKTTFHTRWPCHVCSGFTEKVSILAESKCGIRVCETCLKQTEATPGFIDARLIEHAACLEIRAQSIRQLVGLLDVPTYEEWVARCEQDDREWQEAEAEDEARYKSRKLDDHHAVPATDDEIPF